MKPISCISPKVVSVSIDADYDAVGASLRLKNHVLDVLALFAIFGLSDKFRPFMMERMCTCLGFSPSKCTRVARD